MKKISMIMIIFVCLLVLTGCGNSKTLTCTQEESSSENMIEKIGYEIKLKFDKEGKNLTKFTSTTYAIYNSSVSDDDFASEYEEASSLCEDYKDYVGTVCKTSKSGYRMQVVIDVDVNKLDDETKKNLGLDATDVQSYDAAKTSAEGNGYTCK